MDKISELIKRYEQSAMNYCDDVVMIELEKINRLYDKYQETAESVFAYEMMTTFFNIADKQAKRILDFDFAAFDESDIDAMLDAFCKILKIQRDLIGCLERDSVCESDTHCGENEFYADADIFAEGNVPSGHNFAAYHQNVAEEGFRDDKQLQAAFTDYCLKNGKSSYTANDYCSRIKNLWKNFYSEYKEGKLSGNLMPVEEKIDPDCSLLNVYNQADLLSEYIMIKIEETDANRNWTNARAAFNKFDKFRMSIK